MDQTFLETSILLAVMEEDFERAQKLIDGMSMRERAVFAAQLDETAAMVRG